MCTERKAYQLAWRINSSLKWGQEVVIFDPMESETQRIYIVPNDAKPFSWRTPSEARAAAVAALRDLADRIEQDEK